MNDPDLMKAKKQYEKEQRAKAVEWLLGEGKGERPVVAARIFHIDAGSVRKALKAAQELRRKQHGGNNKILTPIQVQALEKYCKEQCEIGLGATKQMLFSAVTYLLEQENRPPPSKSWFQKWLRATTSLHTIKTKPIARVRVETHDETTLDHWFNDSEKGLHAVLHKYKIRHARSIWNFDESGARIGCPSGEEVVVPTNVKELYTPSPENRKSVTIIEAIYMRRWKRASSPTSYSTRKEGYGVVDP